MKNLVSALFLGTAIFLAPGCSQAGASDLDRKQVEAIIKEYLMEHPEIVQEALIEYDLHKERLAIDAVRDQIYEDSRDVAVGPENAKVTIVEFFDYNCGYCKHSTDWLIDVMRKHPEDIRVIFKELPILNQRTNSSTAAAKAALAAHRQGKYIDMHRALMSTRGLTPDRLETIAKNVGLDINTFKKDMKDPAIAKHIQDTLRLGNALPMLTGTPFFMINDEFLAGANTDHLQSLVDTALSQ